MISALTGELRRVDEGRAHLQAGPVLYELLVPASDLTELHTSLGETLTLHTVFYLAGDPNRGGLEPTLIGFLRPEDRAFFNLFTTVKGIGAKTALRALAVPVGQIAHAIETRDARFLVQLDGVGKRTAELIIAELSGKVGHLAGATAPRTALPARTSEDEAAIAVLTSAQMGLRRSEAEALLDRVRQTTPNARSAEELVPEILRLYAQRM